MPPGRGNGEEPDDFIGGTIRNCCGTPNSSLRFFILTVNGLTRRPTVSFGELLSGLTLGDAVPQTGEYDIRETGSQNEEI